MKIIVANWKMNNAFDEADRWIEEFYSNYASKYDQLQDVEMIICPPAIITDYFDGELMNIGIEEFEKDLESQGQTTEDFEPEEVAEIVIEKRLIRLGAQDCHYAPNGSYTGSLSADMLRKVGCEYSIIGHSERRRLCGEVNKMVAKKAIAAADGGLTPIVCIGEPAEVRKNGEHLNFIKNQLLQSIDSNDNYKNLIIAYEPVWAIGSGQTPTIQEIEEVANLIDETLAIDYSDSVENGYILYGGSVSSQNSAEILAIENIDGLLVGNASLDAKEFLEIAAS